MANNPINFVDHNGDDTSTVNHPGSAYSFFSQKSSSGEVSQGDMYTVYGNPKLVSNYLEGGNAKTVYDPPVTKVYHGGNDYGEAGWYSQEDYEYINRDWAGGQVLKEVSWFTQLMDGDRDWNGWAVGADGYLTGAPSLHGGFSTAQELAIPSSTTRLLPITSKAVKSIQAANAVKSFSTTTTVTAAKTASAFKHLNKVGQYSVYSYIKGGALYIGKAKNGVTARYGLKYVNENAIAAFRGLKLSIPNNGIALGVEQALMNLNGFHAGKLANIRYATKNEILVQEGIKFLDANIANWRTLYKLQ
ncbi:MAG: hypothetical protein JJ975_09795 [Bacteroidia bacterium]|nr:hypothetical protein [Bacteroidia bacterium]